MKQKQINKQKVKIFEEKELQEKLKLNKNQIDLILNYQEKFPELLQEKNGFCINARNLYEKLNVGAAYTTWIKRRIKKYNFEASVDFTRFDKSVKAKDTYINTTEYYLTLNMAKELCMVENNNIGNEIRKYFIIMEETLRNYENWTASREIEKNGWNEMKKYVAEWCQRKGFDYTLNTFYIREANLLNQALLNHSASEINYILKNDDKITRDHLDAKINNALNELQQLNSNLLIADIEFDTRKDIIYKTCETKYIGLKETFEKLVA